MPNSSCDCAAVSLPGQRFTAPFVARTSTVARPASGGARATKISKQRQPVLPWDRRQESYLRYHKHVEGASLSVQRGQACKSLVELLQCSACQPRESRPCTQESGSPVIAAQTHQLNPPFSRRISAAARSVTPKQSKSAHCQPSLYLHPSPSYTRQLARILQRRGGPQTHPQHFDPARHSVFGVC